MELDCRYFGASHYKIDPAAHKTNTGIYYISGKPNGLTKNLIWI